MKNFILILSLIATQIAIGQTATVSWDPNTESDLAGYRIYHGRSSESYFAAIDVGNVTTYKISGLFEGETYYFAVTAYDFSGNESNFSEEVSFYIQSDSPLKRPQNFSAAPDSVAGGDTLEVSYSQINEKLDGTSVKHDSIYFGFSYRIPGTPNWHDIARTDTSENLVAEIPLGEIDLTVWNIYKSDGGDIFSNGAIPKRIFIKTPDDTEIPVGIETRQYRAKLILRIKRQ